MVIITLLMLGFPAVYKECSAMHLRMFTYQQNSISAVKSLKPTPTSDDRQSNYPLSNIFSNQQPFLDLVLESQVYCTSHTQWRSIDLVALVLRLECQKENKSLLYAILSKTQQVFDLLRPPNQRTLRCFP